MNSPRRSGAPPGELTTTALESGWIRRSGFHLFYARAETRRAAEDAHLKKIERAMLGARHLGLVDDQLQALVDFSAAAVSDSDAFFAIEAPTDYRLDGDLLTFSSPSPSGSAQNDTVRAHYYRANAPYGVFLLLSHWNSKREDYAGLVRLLNFFGYSCLHMSLPYHDERQSVGVGYAREMVSANIGLTLQANRQAVCDGRAAVAWLQSQGFPHVAVVGSSIGSSIATLLAAHEDGVGSLSCLHMAEDFAKVVLSGTATSHIARSLADFTDATTLERVWAPISPLSYVQRIQAQLGKVLIVSGDFDEVFMPDLTEHYVNRLRQTGTLVRWLRLSCGHYTISSFPHNVRSVLAVLQWLRRSTN